MCSEARPPGLSNCLLRSEVWNHLKSTYLIGTSLPQIRRNCSALSTVLFYGIGFELWKQLNCALYFTHYGTQILVMGRILFLLMTLTDLIPPHPLSLGNHGPLVRKKGFGEIQEQLLQQFSRRQQSVNHCSFYTGQGLLRAAHHHRLTVQFQGLGDQAVGLHW